MNMKTGLVILSTCLLASIVIASNQFGVDYRPGYSPYGPHYSPYGHDDTFVEPAYPKKQKPYPFIDFKKEEKNGLFIPDLAPYHCFMTGAPWTQCGRRSLTSYFLDQCMVFHYMMSANVDGLCGGKKPDRHVLDKTFTWQYEYGKRINTSKYKPAEEVSVNEGYNGSPVNNYKKEICLQRAYVSITTATVLCLTENIIRIKFIEHYAADAAKNPIEGPILYLKKLHTFISKILTCTDRKAALNFPSLWRKFKTDSEKITYDPNAPYYVDPDSNLVSLPAYTNEEASGLDDFTVSDQFICNDKYLIKNGSMLGYYYKDYNDKKYSAIDFRLRCTKSKALESAGWCKLIKKCQGVKNKSYIKGPTRGPHGPNGRHSSKLGEQLKMLTDMTLRGLYDTTGTHTYSETNNRALFRPQSISEIAVDIAGILEQPILEGFGIMYFCGFYSCKANNGGNLDGTCFPKYDSENDWNVPCKVGGVDGINELSEKVDTCLTQRWITAEDIASDLATKRYKERLMSRNYVCMAESSIVRFFETVFEGVGWDFENAKDLVYYRHLASQKCYDTRKQLCFGKSEMYLELKSALTSLISTCETNEKEYNKKKTRHERKGTYGHRYVVPSSGY